MSPIGAKKLPSLEEQRPRDGRTLLLFEVQGPQLPNTFTATDAVRTALELSPELPTPDAIVLVFTFGISWWLEWMKDGPDWLPTLQRDGHSFTLLEGGEAA